MIDSLTFAARVASGRGEAAQFTSLGWVRDAFRRAAGIDPHPGTLNAFPAASADSDTWRRFRARAGTPIIPPNSDFCAARLFRVSLADRLPAAVIVPEVPGYPDDQIEIVAALGLREALPICDGDTLSIGGRDVLPVGAAIFDVDGTLVDSLTAFRVVAEHAAAPHGLTVTDAIVRESLCGGRSFWELVVPPDRDDRDAFVRALSREAARNWPQVLALHGRVLPDLGSALDGLRRCGLRLAIVTGAQRESLEPLRAAGLLDVFDAVIGKEDVRQRKPDPEGLLLCAGRLGIDPSHAVYVGDTPLDVQAARAAGMHSVAVLSGAGDSRLLSSAGPDLLVPSVADLAPLLVPR